MANDKPKTKDQLVTELKSASDKGDWKLVGQISGQIAKLVRDEESAERDAKSKLLETTTIAVKGVIDKAVDKWITEQQKLEPAVVKAMDGVWYVHDFGEKLTTCRLVKSVAKAKGTGGGGGGKKFDVTTTDLLGKFGTEMYGDSGMTIKEAYDSNTDGNYRYKLRMKMLKLAGMS